MRDEIKDYIAGIPDNRRERFSRIVEVIEREAPHAEQTIAYKMPTFQVGDKSISVANQKNYISIYTCANDNIKAFKLKRPEIKTGNTCINLRDSDDFDPEDVADVTRAVFG